MIGVLMKRVPCEEKETSIEGRQCEETQGEDGHLYAKERGLEQTFLSQPSEGSYPADALMLEVWPPGLRQ